MLEVELGLLRELGHQALPSGGEEIEWSQMDETLVIALITATAMIIGPAMPKIIDVFRQRSAKKTKAQGTTRDPTSERYPSRWSQMNGLDRTSFILCQILALGGMTALLIIVLCFKDGPLTEHRAAVLVMLGVSIVIGSLRTWD